MNRLRIIAVTLLWMLGAVAMWAAPKVVWLNPVHDFGAFSEDLGTVKCVFKGVNVGDEPVVVLSARANCGCTVPSYPREKVEPGDTINITVVYNAVGRPGRFAKKVYVNTSDDAKATFTVQGTVVGNSATLASRFPVEAGQARVSNTVVPFGQARKGRVLSGVVNVYNSTDHPIKPAASSLPAYIKAKMHPEIIPVGQQGTLSLTAITDMTPDYGTVTGSFILTADTEKAPTDTVRVSTVMILDEDFTKLTPEQRQRAPKLQLSEKKTDFDRFTPGASKEITITNTGAEPMLIRRIDTASEKLEVKAESFKVKPGKSTRLKIKTKPEAIAAGDILDERILLRVNAPDTPDRKSVV